MQFNENLINNEDSHSQIENVEIPGAEYPDGSDSEGGKINKISALASFMPQIFQDDQITEGINSLNSKQREVFNMVHTWANEYVKYDRDNAQPIHIFTSSSGGTGKSYLGKVIYKAILKALLYY